MRLLTATVPSKVCTGSWIGSDRDKSPRSTHWIYQNSNEKPMKNSESLFMQIQHTETIVECATVFIIHSLHSRFSRSLTSSWLGRPRRGPFCWARWSDRWQKAATVASSPLHTNTTAQKHKHTDRAMGNINNSENWGSKEWTWRFCLENCHNFSIRNQIVCASTKKSLVDECWT